MEMKKTRNCKVATGERPSGVIYSFILFKVIFPNDHHIKKKY